MTTKTSLVLMAAIIMAASCNRNVTEPDALTAASSDNAVIKTTPTALQLSRDPAFSGLCAVSAAIIGNSDQAAVDKMADNFLTISEFVALSKALGFADTVTFRGALAAQQQYSQTLRNKYNMNETTVKTAYILLYPETAQPKPCVDCGIGGGGGVELLPQRPVINSFMTPCQSQYQGCMAGADAEYVWHVTECFGGAIASSAVISPLGGLGFMIGCGGVAIYSLHLARRGCVAAFNGCTN